MLLPLRRMAAAIALLVTASLAFAQQEPAPDTEPQPAPLVDPLRDLRLEQLDAWRKLAERLHDQDDARSELLAAWALFHQFDVDYFTLLEGAPEKLLAGYERQATDWRKQLEAPAEEDPLAMLALKEFEALLDDIDANRLQNERPEGLPGDAPEVQAWNAKFERFQAARTSALQKRGRQVALLYRDGKIDAIRVCVVLLERQIGERVLLEHQEMTASADEAQEFLARRRTLLGKQRDEWERLEQLLPDSDAPGAAVEFGQQVCRLHQQTLDLLAARLAPPADDEAERAAEAERVAALVKRVFDAYRQLHRAAAKAHVGEKLTVEQLARLHDLRMYTAIWSDPALDPGDVVADGVEVAEMWSKLSEQLAKADPDSLDAQFARAKQRDAQVAREERKPPQ